MKFIHKRNCQLAEIISGFSHGSARGLAKVAAIMANGGELNGMKLMSKETWDEMHSDPKEEVEWLLGATSFYTSGGLNRFTENPAHYTKKDTSPFKI